MKSALWIVIPSLFLAFMVYGLSSKGGRLNHLRQQNMVLTGELNAWCQISRTNSSACVDNKKEYEKIMLEARP